mgnify:CR=1 FL=1
MSACDFALGPRLDCWLEFDRTPYQPEVCVIRSWPGLEGIKKPAGTAGVSSGRNPGYHSRKPTGARDGRHEQVGTGGGTGNSRQAA